MPGPSLGAQPKSVDASRPRRVLVVDDEASVRRVLSRWFTRQGFEVSEASNGDQARLWLSSPASHAFDIVICDVRMPELNGAELYAWLEACQPHVIPRLVFTTGDQVHDGVGEFLGSINCMVLDKPFELPALEAAVQRIVASATVA